MSNEEIHAVLMVFYLFFKLTEMNHAGLSVFENVRRDLIPCLHCIYSGKNTENLYTCERYAIVLLSYEIMPSWACMTYSIIVY